MRKVLKWQIHSRIPCAWLFFGRCRCKRKGLCNGGYSGRERFRSRTWEWAGVAPHPPYGHPLPKGRGGKYVILPQRGSPIASKCNFLLAPWGEDARRAGEGLLQMENLFQRNSYWRVILWINLHNISHHIPPFLRDRVNTVARVL